MIHSQSKLKVSKRVARLCPSLWAKLAGWLTASREDMRRHETNLWDTMRKNEDQSDVIRRTQSTLKQASHSLSLSISSACSNSAQLLDLWLRLVGNQSEIGLETGIQSFLGPKRREKSSRILQSDLKEEKLMANRSSCRPKVIHLTLVAVCKYLIRFKASFALASDPMTWWRFGRGQTVQSGEIFGSSSSNDSYACKLSEPCEFFLRTLGT